MHKIINNLTLIADAAEYFDRSTSAAWRIRASLTNMAVWQANSVLYAQNQLDHNDNQDSQRVFQEQVKLSTIRCFLNDASTSSFVLDLTESAVRRTLGLDRNTDPHQDAVRIARQKCLAQRNAAKFKEYYQRALEAAEERHAQREQNAAEITNMLSDQGWHLRGTFIDGQGQQIMYDGFVEDETLYDEATLDQEMDRFAETVAAMCESMWDECDRQYGAAITTARVNRLGAFKKAIEKMMDVVGVDKKALAKRKVALEAMVEDEIGKVNAEVAEFEQELNAAQKAVTTDE